MPAEFDVVKLRAEFDFQESKAVAAVDAIDRRLGIFASRLPRFETEVKDFGSAMTLAF